MLVVIDIQECYIREFQRQKKKFNTMMAGLSNRIQQARDNEELVINLTHFEDGFTLPEVIELVKSCKGSFFLGKEEMDGSAALHYSYQRKEIKPDYIELSGVFRNVCVLKTWKGLKNLGYNVLQVDKELTMSTSSTLNENMYPNGYLGD